MEVQVRQERMAATTHKMRPVMTEYAFPSMPGKTPMIGFHFAYSVVRSSVLTKTAIIKKSPAKKEISMPKHMEPKIMGPAKWPKHSTKQKPRRQANTAEPISSGHECLKLPTISKGL